MVPWVNNRVKAHVDCRSQSIVYSDKETSMKNDMKYEFVWNPTGSRDLATYIKGPGETCEAI
jgi:hypothetical protein